MSSRFHSIYAFLFSCFVLLISACGGGSTESDPKPDDDGTDPAAGLSVTLRVVSMPAETPNPTDLYVAGSFNGWKPADPAYRLSKGSDGQWQITLTELTDGNLYEYKFTRGSWGTVEKTLDGKEVANRTFVFGEKKAIDHTVDNWADLIQVPVTHTYNATQFNIIEKFSMPQLGRERRIWVYLPPDYQSSARRYPVLYMHDAQNLFDDATSFLGEWGVDETLNQLHAQGQHPGVIVVGIDNDPDKRYEEYSPWMIKDINGKTRGGEGASYAKFLVETLKPYIDTNYRTLSEAANTGIAGSSMGGLISLYAGLSYPQVFGRVGVISPYISEIRIGSAVFDFVKAQTKAAGQKVYVDIGGKEVVRNENKELVLAAEKLRDALSQIGFKNDDFWYNYVPDAQHNEKAWSVRFGDVVTWMMPPDAGGEDGSDDEGGNEGEPEDPVSTDKDSDGMPNDFEKTHNFLNENDAADAALDFDHDTLTNLEEYKLGTQLDRTDSDTDGLPDGVEHKLKLNPLLAADAQDDLDSDGMTNLAEHQGLTKLDVADTDGDGVLDGKDFYPLDKTRWEEMIEPELAIKLFHIPANTPANASIYVAGTFNAWNPASPTHQLKKGSDGVWSVTLTGVKVADTLKFKFTRGSWATVEKDRSNVEVLDRVYTIGKGRQIHAAFVENWADIAQVYSETQRGDIRVIKDFQMPQLGRTRTIRIYVPPNYDAQALLRYPVIYMYDGQNVFNAATTAFGVEWSVDETLQRLYFEQKTEGVIVVAVDNGGSERGCEYNVFAEDPHPFCAAGTALGDKYNQFIVETLKPYVDKNYRTKSDRANTFIAGSSMGGHMALKMGLTYPNVFSKVVALSPSYQNQLQNPFKMPGHIQSLSASLDVSIYQNMGEAEQIRDITASTLIKNMQAVHDALVAKGFDKTKLAVSTTPGAKHEERAWAQRFPDVVTWLLR